jgi:hypothetical protein
MAILSDDEHTCHCHHCHHCHHSVHHVTTVTRLSNTPEVVFWMCFWCACVYVVILCVFDTALQPNKCTNLWPNCAQKWSNFSAYLSNPIHVMETPLTLTFIGGLTEISHHHTVAHSPLGWVTWRQCIDDSDGALGDSGELTMLTRWEWSLVVKWVCS